MSFRPPEEHTPAFAAKTKVADSSLVSRNITVNGKRTSVRLEPEMWLGLQDIRRREHTTLHEICSLIAQRKAENTSLTAAIRVFIMGYFRNAASEEGHAKAGHGRGLHSSATSGAAIGAITLASPTATTATPNVMRVPSDLNHLRSTPFLRRY